MAGAYYNEKDPHAAAWLRWLIAERLIPAGDVDERSIVDVQPDDLRGYVQAHFFAGVGGWPHAARLAGWPDDRPIWTGSCPCQPYSVAGKRRGADDERNLWPDFFRLIRACRPLVVMGEQVAGKAGRGWFDGVRSNMEGEDYACRAVNIPACAVDAPHIRQRIYWVASDLANAARERGPLQRGGGSGFGPRQLPSGGHHAIGTCWSSCDVAHTDGGRRDRREEIPGRDAQWGISAERVDARSLEHAAGIGRGEGRSESEFRGGRTTAAGADAPSALGNTDGDRQLQPVGDVGKQRRRSCDSDAFDRALGNAAGWRPSERDSGGGDHGAQFAPAVRADGRNGSFWADGEWIACHDGKARRAQPGTPLLVARFPSRVAAWRGLGNAVNTILAAEVIAAFMDVADRGDGTVDA